ncbi:hypothetical protein L336_0161 [Candidatus Saccharimonas aalborgensis]|uniref:Resolvase/invertase-type recombinase catalytic domain-containing protein n=1 Tax=Candidatus Saccharimonas aalborgensis TaxID=1332188 RepID=R4PXF3_9BACT|nr:recombinase family protein [Candidatus Saccharimonas aalborgensis]AGL61871.1 hypothetical protein L336_0161 [Candidatus Saccharimonas aalborgensis]QQS68399.1 MAG: recombinase family protein [Candidatus Saccharibacteria bacterium]
MSDLAIALCRVSSTEQLDNNSLNRQHEAVFNASKELGVEIIKWWSGSVSSKRGSNVQRKDLLEIYDFAKKNKRVKYLIVDEPDRFMRSIDESGFWEVKLFYETGTRVWYASNPELNKDDLPSKLLKFTKFLQAEGSNEERISKSVSGGKKAIREGRLPSGPKAGYKKGTMAGVHIVDPITGEPLKRALRQIASNLKTPTDALKELQETEFGKRYAKLKMDKFRIIACEPYYAGIIDLKGKFNERNEHGLHEPLITRTEHEKILRVFERNVKKQQGHRPDKNTKYPLSNELTCISCEAAKRKYPRFTSVPLNNGKTNHGKPRKKVSYYAKYKCRECNRFLDRDETHASFSNLLDAVILPNAEMRKLKIKLVTTFNAKHHEAKSEIQRLEAVNANIKQSIAQKADAVTNPSFVSISDEIMASIEKLKAEFAENEDKIAVLSEQHETDLAEFLDFSFNFLSNKGGRFFELSGEDMKRCKQLLFTGKIYVDENKNVYTHNISSIFRGQSNKKDLPVTEKSSLVQHS